MRRKRGLRLAAPQSRAGKLAVLALGAVATGYVCARLIVLLADVRPYTGWYLLPAVAIGIVVAVAFPWACVRAFRSPARWAGWLLPVYAMAVVGGMRYYLLLRFTPPGSVPAVLPPPPLWFVLEIVGLSAVSFSIAAVTLLILAVMAEVIAPGPVGGRVRAWSVRRERAVGHPGSAGARFPARLRAEAPGGPEQKWLRGAIHVRPGSLRWEPDAGSGAVPAELTSAVIVPGDAGSGQSVTVDTPAGRVRLDCRAETFALLQHLAIAPDDISRGQAAAREG
jgi:hypothetical protein